MFEPLAAVNDGQCAPSMGIGKKNAGRSEAYINDWCSCGHCAVMPSDEECRCCREISQVVKKSMECEPHADCITLHPGFQSVALCPWTLQAVYYAYRSEYGDMMEPSLHEQYRYTAYRHFVRWCWKYVGTNIRTPLPACVVNSIRTRFPSDTYAGFKLPKLY